MILRTTSILAATLLLAGCWPARFTERPGIVGTVVSADDHQPIAHARVKLTSPSPVDKADLELVTDGRGRFEVRPLYYWALSSFLGEAWPIQGAIEVEAMGFASQKRELIWPQTGPATQDVGAISLVRSP